MLTLGKLKAMTPNAAFAWGTANDDPQGLFMANTKDKEKETISKVLTDNWTAEILNAFAEVIFSKKNKHGVRLQRKKFIVMFRGWPYTFTIERGDRLNERGTD